MQESNTRRERRSEKSVSVIGWIGTLLLSSIPVVNLIFWIACIFASNSRSRKNFAIASLILFFLVVVALVALAMVFGAQLSAWAVAYYGQYMPAIAP